MSVTVMLHINNEDPVICELDEMIKPTDLIVIGKNPRKRDGKDLPQLAHGVTTVIWPMNRMTFIEIMPSDEEEKVISFVRE